MPPGQGRRDFGFHTKPGSWHFMHVSIFFLSQAGRYKQFGMKMNLYLKKKKVSPLVSFQTSPAQVQPGDMLKELQGKEKSRVGVECRPPSLPIHLRPMQTLKQPGQGRNGRGLGNRLNQGFQSSCFIPPPGPIRRTSSVFVGGRLRLQKVT